MARSDIVKVGTKRDWRAFKQLVKRSDLGLKEPDVLALEPVVNEDEEIRCDHHWQDGDSEWHDCEQPARVRIVRQRSPEREFAGETIPAKRYSDAFCLACLQRAFDAWLDERLEAIADGVDVGGDSDAR